MIYLDTPHEYDPCDGCPPMAGTRVGHEVLTENVILIRVDHARQTFRGDRRSLIMLDVIGDREPECGSDLHKELSDKAVNYTGVKPLISR